MTTIKTIEVSGSPYECGKQHGTQLAELILNNIEKYLRLIQYHTNMQRESALYKAAQYLKVVESYDNNLVEEMQGVADGSGTTIEEIALLNTRSELLASVPLRECTSIAVLPPASKHETFLLQNWDWYCDFQSTCALLKIKQRLKPEIIMLVEAGQIGKLGFNSAGIGLTHNWLETNYHSIGVPFILLCRAILNNWTIKEAIHDLCRSKRGVSGNFMIAHRDGFAIDFEMMPDTFDYFEPVDGILVHTNHFLSARFQANDAGLHDNGWDSLVRRQTAERLLKAKRKILDKASLQAIQRDLSFGSDAINLPRDQNLPLEEQWSTLARILMNLTQKTMHIELANAALSDYTTAILSD